jgi:hypothetical protein
MEVILHEEMFTNNKLLIEYGNRRQALFTIVDEEYEGLNNLGRINRIVILVTQQGPNEEAQGAQICTSIIGISDTVVGIRSEDISLRGKVLNHENMDKCVVELYE